MENKNTNTCRVIAMCNQKGGVGKTTTTVSLGAALTRCGYKVLLIDNDSQASLTVSLGMREPDELDVTLTNIFQDIMSMRTPRTSGIIHHEEGFDFLPSNITLSGLEITIVSQMSREYMLKSYISQIEKYYDYIIIDCSPTLGMLTVNALTAADSVIIPTQPHYLSAKGLELLLNTIVQVQRQTNPDLNIMGILLTMVDGRRNFDKQITEMLKAQYDGNINVFDTYVPASVRAAEASSQGVSVLSYDSKNAVAVAYKELTKEVINHGKEA